MALAYGVDDLDGTIDDTTKIYSMAGSEERNPSLTTKQLAQLIIQAGRQPVERDTLYHVVKTFTDADVEERWRGYLDLPVTNNPA